MVISLKPDHSYAYHRRGAAYFFQGKDPQGYRDAIKAAALGNCELLDIMKATESPTPHIYKGLD